MLRPLQAAVAPWRTPFVRVSRSILFTMFIGAILGLAVNTNYITTSYFLTTASESSLPGKKRTRSFAGTSIGLRSRGLTPFRAAL